MDTLDTRTLIIGIVAVLALLAVVGWFFGRRKQSYRLAQRFGPEYGHTVDALGSRSKAETELKTRESRVDGLHIVALTNTDAGRFSQAWGDLQGRFVDNPKGVVIQADQLVRELMAKRGYPVADFERRAADISVDHPAVVENYRAAQAIASRDKQGQADTEDLRKAVVHYRVLFDELLEVKAVTPDTTRAHELAAQS